MISLLKISYCDVPRFWQLGIQDPATPIAEGMVFFHNYLMVYIIFIGVFVFYMLFEAYKSTSKKAPSKFSHSNLLEIIWTVVPALTLIIIAVPSFSLLYSLDDIVDPEMTVKAIGHQWYWSYEYSDQVFIKKGQAPIRLPINYDCYLLNTSDFIKTKDSASIRLLETNTKMFLPLRTHVRLLVTSSDVLHSWAVPSLGVKIDATPGRLSQVSIFIKRPGEFFGQCSEICGINHGFMPIHVRVPETKVNLEYAAWWRFRLMDKNFKYRQTNRRAPRKKVLSLYKALRDAENS